MLGIIGKNMVRIIWVKLKKWFHILAWLAKPILTIHDVTRLNYFDICM